MPRYIRSPAYNLSQVRKVNASSHQGRLFLAFLSLEGRPWHNHKQTFKGYPVVDSIHSDIPNDVDYVIESCGLVVLHHLKGAARDNLRFKDPRRLVPEWKSPLSASETEALNGTQINHCNILAAYLEPHYSWDDIPPFRTKDGKLPWFMRGEQGNALNDDDDA